MLSQAEPVRTKAVLPNSTALLTDVWKGCDHCWSETPRRRAVTPVRCSDRWQHMKNILRTVGVRPLALVFSSSDKSEVNFSVNTVNVLWQFKQVKLF